MKLTALLLLTSLPLAAPLAARTINVAPGANAQEALQTALIEAAPGDTVQLAAGRYALTGGVSLDVKGVTVAGAGPDKTILDFTGQKGEGEGLLVTSSDVVIRDLAVENAKGNGIKSKGSDGISFVNLRVEWTGGPKSTNGAYGVYPVSSKHVLIDKVYVKGASDAGIYVGQSQQIVVRNSKAEGNVAGIEIENSYNADVHDNVATGVMVMANRNVHVFDNDIKNNGGNAVMIVSYRSAFTDKAYNPLPRAIAVHGNRYAGNGGAPAFDGGPQIAAAVGGTLPPAMWDGVTAFTVPGGAATTADGGIFVSDAPLLNLNLKTQGTPASAAQPTVTPPQAKSTLAQPAVVVLPSAQEARAKS